MKNLQFSSHNINKPLFNVGIMQNMYKIHTSKLNTVTNNTLLTSHLQHNGKKNTWKITEQKHGSTDVYT
jgi:hypothetical protein